MITKLGKICTIDWGNTSLTKKSYQEDGKFLAVSATGCDGRINHYEHEEDVCVLSAIGAQCGKMFFPQEKFTAIKNTITLTPKKELVNSKFLYYLFTFIQLPKRGTAQPFISKGDIEKFEINNLPELKEQQRIVAKLDAAFAEIDLDIQNTNEAINLSKINLKKIIDNKTRRNDNWAELKVKDLGIVKTGSTPKTSQKDNYGSEIPFVKPPHFNSDGSITISDVGLSKKGSKLSRNAPANSVLMVCIGATIGKVGINNIDVCFNLIGFLISFIRTCECNGNFVSVSNEKEI